MATNTNSLQLRQNNPYSVGSIFQFPEGDVLLDRVPLTYVPSSTDRYYTVEQGESLWSIAGRADVFGQSKYWWIIADVNDIDNGFNLGVGTTLIIPTLSNALLNS